jgi:TfoX/Sxy family transcriptional regulator of competence genes
MAYDDKLAARVRSALAGREGLSERKMFGGLAFMLNGNMACGLTADALMVRVGAERFQEALAEPHARPMNFTGRPMKGMVYVDPAGYATDDGLAAWVERGLQFAASLPPK